MKRIDTRCWHQVLQASAVAVSLWATTSMAAPPEYNLRIIEGSLAPGAIATGRVSVQMLEGGGHRCTQAGCELIPALPNDVGMVGIQTSAMNERGWVAGHSQTANGWVRHAVLFNGRKVRDLGALDDDACDGCSLESGAAGLNLRGDVVGYSQDAAKLGQAVIWRRGGRPLRLGSLGGTESYAADINDRGEAVGSARRADGLYAPFLWRDGQMQELPSPDGRKPAYGVAIDNAGRVVIGTGPSLSSRAFLVDNGRVVPIGDRPDALDSIPLEMNHHGWVVGWWILRNDRGTSTSGYVFDGKQTHDLNDLLEPAAKRALRILSADDINDQGQILATALHKPTFDNVMVVLTPKPASAR
jgi:uncharacterized membrane protein